MSNAGGIRRSGAERTVVLTLLGLLAALCWACLLFRVGRMAPIGTGAAGRTWPRPTTCPTSGCCSRCGWWSSRR